MIVETVDMEVKKRYPDGWRNIDLGEMAGKTLRECFETWDGDEVVVQTDKGMICGTETWQKYYEKRGRITCSFPEAIGKLENPSEISAGNVALDHVLVPHEVFETFDRSAVVKSEIVAQKGNLEPDEPK